MILLTQKLFRALGDFRDRAQCRLKPGRRLFEIGERVFDPGLVGVARNLVQPIEQVGGLLQQRLAGLREVVEHVAAHFYAGEPSGGRGKGGCIRAVVVQYQEGDPGQSLVTDLGEGAAGNGHAVVQQDPDQYVLGVFRVECNVIDLADIHAAEANRGLAIQAVDRKLGNHEVIACNSWCLPETR